MLHIYLGTKKIVISKGDFQAYNNDVGTAFIVLQTNMRPLLKCANCADLRNACIIQKKTPYGPKLSEELLQTISTTESSDKLFDLLVESDYWSWIEIRVLEAMVTASQNPDAHELLENYKAVIFSKRLLDVLPKMPCKEVKEKYYDKVVAKIQKGSSDILVSDLLDFQPHLEDVIMDITKGNLILKHVKKGCMEVYWYFPTSCVDRAYKNAARVKHCQFSKFHLQSLKIGHNPLIYYQLNQTDFHTSTHSHSGNIN